MNELRTQDLPTHEVRVQGDVLRVAPASDAARSGSNGASASLTFAWRALLKIKHVPEQLFDVTATPILFTLMFTYLFGGALAGSTGAYLQFLLPGILVQTIVLITVYTGFSLNTDMSKGVADRFRTLPIWQPSLLVGMLLGDAARYLIASTVVVGLGLILGYRPEGGAAGVVAAVALLLVFAFGIGWAFTILGLLMRSPNAVMGASMMILMPLTFASNIFVEPATMPSALQAFVEANPVTILVTAVRGLMAGAATLGQVASVVAISAGFTAVFAPITMAIYRRR